MSSTSESDTPTPGRGLPIQRLTYRIDDLAQALGVSRRILEREHLRVGFSNQTFA